MKPTRAEPAERTLPTGASDAALERMYHREYRSIHAVCAANGLQHTLCRDSIRIVSRYDCWRICLHIHTGQPILLHRTRRPDAEVRAPHYHLQACTRRTITQIIRYIVQHDLYRLMQDTPPTFRNSTKGRKARKTWEQEQRRRQVIREKEIREELQFTPRLPEGEAS